MFIHTIVLSSHPYDGNQRYRVEGCGDSNRRHEVFGSRRMDIPCRGRGQRKEEVSRTGEKMQWKDKIQTSEEITIRRGRHCHEKQRVRLRHWKLKGQ